MRVRGQDKTNKIRCKTFERKQTEKSNSNKFYTKSHRKWVSPNKNELPKLKNLKVAHENTFMHRWKKNNN